MEGTLVGRSVMVQIHIYKETAKESDMVYFKGGNNSGCWFRWATNALLFHQKLHFAVCMY